MQAFFLNGVRLDHVWPRLFTPEKWVWVIPGSLGLSWMMRGWQRTEHGFPSCWWWRPRWEEAGSWAFRYSIYLSQQPLRPWMVRSEEISSEEWTISLPTILGQDMQSFPPPFSKNCTLIYFAEMPPHHHQSHYAIGAPAPPQKCSSSQGLSPPVCAAWPWPQWWVEGSEY